MATNVIREDVIKLSFETENFKALTKLQNDVNELKKKLTGDMGSDALDDLKDSATKAKKPLKDLKEKADKVKKSVTDIGKKAATTAFNGLKKLAGVSFKALAVGIGAAATAITGLVTQAVSAYAEFEQLKGGVETLFGAKGAKSVEEYAKIVGKSVSQVKKEYDNKLLAEKTVTKNANDAFKTAGLSANQYMETVTSFSASLISSLGGDTNKAADLAHIAIVDMSDNANKMGTSMESIQYAYQGFAKQNYTMLDNLKLGYGGTKTEMQRLVKDAAKLDKSVDANSLSFGNIVKAIHAVQENMYITGTTSKEASFTITGSVNAMKAAWGNLLPALIQGGDQFDQCVKNLIDSIVGFEDETGKRTGGVISNLKPAIQTALSGVGTLIEELAPVIEKELPTLIDELLPPLIKAAVSLTAGLIKALPSIAKAIVKEIPHIAKTLWQAIEETFGEQFPIVKKFSDFFKDNADSIKSFFKKGASAITKFIPVVIALIAAFKMFKGVKSVTSIFSSLTGGKGGKGGKSGGFLSNLTSTFKELAKAKTTTILKGMANLAIILGGFTLLAAAFAFVSPYIAELTDFKSLIKTVAAVALLGLLGTALAKMSEIVGKISVATVAKGLANMAIMIAGTSALFLLVGALSLINFDYKKMLQITGLIAALGLVGTALAVFGGIVGMIPVVTVALGLANMAIMLAGMSALLLLIHAASFINYDFKKILQIAGILTVLGIVGTALSVFAGIVGMIPIPIVLAGLVNMALVLGGITGLIVAFAKLSEIKGFNDFITTGGETLAKVFNVIGQIGGSLVGGFGESLSKSLPTIGENLGKFGENIKPLFTAMQGIDMGGVGSFFTSLVGLLGIATGNEIVEGIKSFFGGDDESALAKLGTNLTDFAKNSQGFFTTVSTLPENGFTNATKLFECLAGVKSLPKEGGIAQWFTGTISYTSLADGLAQLSSDKVVGFFNTVSTLQQAGFDNATKLFECLAGVKSLPKDGGIAQWFAGTISYTDLAAGLKALSGDGVKGFFEMVSNLKPAAFDNTSKLFAALAGIGDLPKTDGLAQWFSGETSLGDIADDLKSFGEKTGDFFTQINNLNVSNLNALWDSLKKAESLTASVSQVVDENINDIVDKISELPEKMGEGLKESGQSLADALVSVWKEAVKASVAPVNKVLEAANWILKEFGSSKRVISWQPYAKGTDGHKGGNALVNDGNGAELVQMPNGTSFIPRGKNVLIPNAPKGMKVLPAGQTAQLMGKSSPTYRYANGIGDIDIWSYIDNASGLVSRIKDSVSYDGMSGFPLSVGQGMVTTFTGEMSAWVEKLFDEAGALSLADYVASKGVEQWRTTVIRALKMEGQYSAANVQRTLYQMQTESGGNPYAINLWDSNAKKGTPSKGLMQVIDPTFNAYARAGFNKNIYDPLSNILASVRYAIARYGTLAKAYRGVGYANGGIATKPSVFGEDGAEMAIPLSKDKRNRGRSLWAQTGEMLGMSYTPESSATSYSTNNTEYNTYSPQFNLTISGTSDDRSTARKVKKWIREAIDDTFDSFDSKNPKLREV